jgi:hypothetical protein
MATMDRTGNLLDSLGIADRSNSVDLKILLQCKHTSLFLKNPHDWTSQAEEAIDFPTTTAAANTSCNYGISEARIVLRFEGRMRDLFLSDSWMDRFRAWGGSTMIM